MKNIPNLGTKEFNDLASEVFGSKPKKETIEEAAEKYAESNQYDLESYDEGGYLGIDTKVFAKKLLDFISKWQQDKKMYSEEEVYNLLYQLLPDKEELDKWFEQVKKK
jgi:hypothetical protein